MYSPNPATNRFVRLFLLGSLVIIVVAYGLLYLITTPLLEKQYANDVAIEIDEALRAYSKGGSGGIRGFIDKRIEESRHYEAVYLLQSPTGVIISGNISSWPAYVIPDGRWRHVKLIRWPDVRPVTIGIRAVSLPSREWLLIGRDLKASTMFRERITQALTASLLITMIIGIAGSYMLSSMLLKRIDAMTSYVDEIMRGDLTPRFRTSGNTDEFSRLARALNGMLDRISELMTAMRAITDSVAHDMRSTLMRIKTRFADLHQDPQLGPDSRKTLSTIMAETDALLSTLDALLQIARAEAGLGREQMTIFNLSELAQDIGELYQPVAEDQQLTLIIDAEQSLRVRGHRQLLAQAVANLIENAIKYSSPGGKIILKTYLGQAGPAISVSDSGPGISDQDRERAVERFVQLENAPAGSGQGLGLSLVAAVAKLHHAEFSLLDNEPGLRAVIKFLTRYRR